MHEAKKVYALLTLAVALAILGYAAPASAHVTVSSSSTAPGARVTLTFEVPTESSTARTTGLTVQLPTDTPFTSVLTQTVPGWTVTTTRSALPRPLTDDDGNAVTSAITRVRWTATGAGIGPGQFGTFVLAVGALPDSGTVYLPTVQQYSDGTRVDWVQQAHGGAEAEHPAPRVDIIAPRLTEVSSASVSTPVEPVDRLGIAAIVLALLAGAVSGAALTRTRR